MVVIAGQSIVSAHIAIDQSGADILSQAIKWANTPSIGNWCLARGVHSLLFTAICSAPHLSMPWFRWANSATFVASSFPHVEGELVEARRPDIFLCCMLPSILLPRQLVIVTCLRGSAEKALKCAHFKNKGHACWFRVGLWGRVPYLYFHHVFAKLVSGRGSLILNIFPIRSHSFPFKCLASTGM